MIATADLREEQRGFSLRMYSTMLVKLGRKKGQSSPVKPMRQTWMGVAEGSVVKNVISSYVHAAQQYDFSINVSSYSSMRY
jgi:hypothetical protein